MKETSKIFKQAVATERKDGVRKITEDYNCSNFCRLCPFPGAKCIKVAQAR